jgi:hypothetical protein
VSAAHRHVIVTPEVRVRTVLINVDNCRTDQGKAVDMRCEDRPFFVDPNTVKAALRKLLSCPLAAKER